MILVIQTQYRENYGTKQEPYWKNKGGSDYKITNIPFPSEEEITKIVMASREKLEYFESMSEEHIIHWFFAPDDYLSDFEKSQLEFDGEITYKEPTIEYEELFSGSI